jgi:hypothetical protein
MKGWRARIGFLAPPGNRTLGRALDVRCLSESRRAARDEPPPPLTLSGNLFHSVPTFVWKERAMRCRGVKHTVYTAAMCDRSPHHDGAVVPRWARRPKPHHKTLGRQGVINEWIQGT